jgi:RNA-directed DNA polymerase
MERSNQPPKTECCRGEGQSEGATEASRSNDSLEAYTGQITGRKQDSHPAKATQPRDGTDKQAGTEFPITEPNTSQSASGEDGLGLPGSKSVASEERAFRNLGDPSTRRSNCESQAGRPLQRQEGEAQKQPGFRWTRTSWPQPLATEVEASQGGHKSSQPAKETSAVRATECNWPTSLRAIARKAQQDKRYRFGGLYRLINVESLRSCFYQLRKDAAVGIDGVSFKDYEKDLEANLRRLVERLKQKSYHARLIRRKYIPKGGGKWRPLGILVLEDKLVQRVVADLLNAIYEADFLPCNQGYRPGRGARECSRKLAELLTKGRMEFVVEADIKGFFENVQHSWLVRMLKLRIADEALVGLIVKWLKAGVLEEDGKVVHPESGTPQGGIVSPVLANVYLHYVLDLWFEHKVRRRNRGQSELVRYADDFVCGFAYRHEAEAFLQRLSERLQKFGLEVAPDKTKMLRFGRGGGPYNGRFDFLGFEFYWRLSRKGWPVVQRRTSRKRLQRSVAGFTEWIRGCRHQKLRETLETLASKYRGYWNYYGVRGNSESLEQFYQQTRRILCKWLNRRSQKKSYTARAFQRVVRRFHIPQPRIMETVPAAVRRTRAGVTSALSELFRRYNHPSSAEAR